MAARCNKRTSSDNQCSTNAHLFYILCAFLVVIYFQHLRGCSYWRRFAASVMVEINGTPYTGKVWRLINHVPSTIVPTWGDVVDRKNVGGAVWPVQRPSRSVLRVLQEDKIMERPEGPIYQRVQSDWCGVTKKTVNEPLDTATRASVGPYKRFTVLIQPQGCGIVA